ncbi:MAG: 2-dehydro-3-deoxygalactonokinase [Spirosoma sp.]|nr:2-dehydro-3-deoxygalactonokinase [Spirosoma sp.]
MNRVMNEFLLSCDWGTSSFRLRLVDTRSGRVLGEQLLPTGVAATFDTWKIEHDRTEIERETFFSKCLNTQIDALADSLAISLEHVPVVLSGMASSSIGMAELPYANLPFSLDGSQVSVRWFAPRPGFNHRLLLISGVRGPKDVMRGEETQMIGLSDLLTEANRSVLIFPGTHSKHMYIENGQLVDFQTFMTGEVFSVLTSYSILKESTDVADLANGLTRYRANFQEGVRASESPALLHELFAVRTNQLFGKLTRPQNALYLSGLLIGAELRTLFQKPDWRLVLCCDNNLVDFYTEALTVLGLWQHTTRIDADHIRYAATEGHLKIMNHQLTLAETAS